MANKISSTLGHAPLPLATCPATLKEARETPNLKPYFGLSTVFHCGYSGFLEDRFSNSVAPQQECFYRPDETLALDWCGGSSNDYDSAENWFRHSVADSGGIFSWAAVKGAVASFFERLIPAAW